MDIGNARCPDCNKPMMPIACKCSICGIRMEGNFTVSILSQLPPDDQALVIAFMHSFGSIKKIQDLLDVSYPTARARIAEVIKRLDSTMNVPDEQENEILEKLERGDISFEEAMENL
jgi:hypothetical protein